jgi:dipeptidyl-peptidase-3
VELRKKKKKGKKKCFYQFIVFFSYKVVNACAEAGDSSPSTPIGVNLPNLSWVRSKYGSKSVSLGNIEHASNAAPSSGMRAEFCYDDEEERLSKLYGDVSDKIHTALHEVLGHASGQLEPGVAQPHHTLGLHYSTMEEARADLFGLYYIMDPKLVELGVVENVDVARNEYNAYIRGGLLTQLIRLNCNFVELFFVFLNFFFFFSFFLKKWATMLKKRTCATGK